MRAALLLKTFGRSIPQRQAAPTSAGKTSPRPRALSQNYISDIERGVRNPGMLRLVALALAMRVALRELVDE